MSRRLAETLRRSYVRALGAIDMPTATADALRRVKLKGEVIVVALGKCAASMLAGAVPVLVGRGTNVRRVLVARPTRAAAVDTRTRTTLRRSGARFDEFATGHPLPDAASVRAGRAISRALAGAARTGTVVVLLSGGSSASLCVPKAGWTLASIRRTTRDLLASGASITKVNAARARFDASKRGGLARTCAAATLYTLVSVDIAGAPRIAARSVGSAPTVRTRARGARPLIVVVSPHDARAALAAELRRAGFVVSVGRDLVGDTANAAGSLARVAARIAPGHAWIASGEPTVVLPARVGRGGRAGRTAVLAAGAIEGRRDVACLAVSTDGVDGESGHAGAAVDGDTLRRARRAGVDPQRALDQFNDAVVLAAARDHIDVRPTGLNLLDLYGVIRAR